MPDTAAGTAPRALGAVVRAAPLVAGNAGLGGDAVAGHVHGPLAVLLADPVVERELGAGVLSQEVVHLPQLRRVPAPVHVADEPPDLHGAGVPLAVRRGAAAVAARLLRVRFRRPARAAPRAELFGVSRRPRSASAPSTFGCLVTSCAPHPARTPGTVGWLGASCGPGPARAPDTTSVLCTRCRPQLTSIVDCLATGCRWRSPGRILLLGPASRGAAASLAFLGCSFSGLFLRLGHRCLGVSFFFLIEGSNLLVDAVQSHVGEGHDLLVHPCATETSARRRNSSAGVFERRCLVSFATGLLDASVGPCVRRPLRSLGGGLPASMSPVPMAGATSVAGGPRLGRVSLIPVFGLAALLDRLLGLPGLARRTRLWPGSGEGRLRGNAALGSWIAAVRLLLRRHAHPDVAVVPNELAARPAAVVGLPAQLDGELGAAPGHHLRDLPSGPEDGVALNDGQYLARSILAHPVSVEGVLRCLLLGRRSITWNCILLLRRLLIGRLLWADGGLLCWGVSHSVRGRRSLHGDVLLPLL
mmetsp:Transcript_79083/g.235648  ORF Transcript_79083/g.235648 Transcript_79083/m.235648 type:complete len:529 (-) Transcript_79083:1797-3383(-)